MKQPKHSVSLSHTSREGVARGRAANGSNATIELITRLNAQPAAGIAPKYSNSARGNLDSRGSEFLHNFFAKLAVLSFALLSWSLKSCNSPEFGNMSTSMSKFKQLSFLLLVWFMSFLGIGFELISLRSPFSPSPNHQWLVHTSNHNIFLTFCCNRCSVEREGRNSS